LLAPPVEGRTIPFGAHKGEPAWQEVPGEYRAMLRRLITVQGDTEPASVEQQRHLGATAPSLYDLRNLFQVNVEEGRHLWAMVYLLQKYFGRDGREEAEDLLRRRSGDQDSPRLLGAFNQATPDWLAFFMFTFFTDRDGKMQLHALSQSGFDPLSRTCRFMLTEEAHHMFVGQSGIGRVIERTCAAMREAGIDDPTDVERVRALGVIDLPTLQKRANLHFSLTLDLFGNEISTNAANAFNAGLKGRYQEDQVEDDHQLVGATYPVLRLKDGRIATEQAPALSALNMRLRDDYVNDALSGVDRWWNRIIARAGFDYRLHLPYVAFNRRIGEFAGLQVDPEGKILDAGEWERQRSRWLPTTDDDAFVASLMKPTYAPGAYASWIAPPRAGIDGKAGNFEYVKIAS
jgi:benzoyl-CoA 2,3-dioxygenase component B